MKELLALRKLFTETLLTEIYHKFQSSSMMPLVDGIFFFCLAIGMFNVFRSLGSRAFGKDILSFIFKAWIAYALVYGNSTFSASLGGGSSQPIFMTLYYKVADIGSKLEQEVQDSGDDEAGLAYKTDQLIDFQDNLVDSLINCDNTSPTYQACMTAYLKNGVPPPEIMEAEKEESTFWGSLTGYDTIIHYLSLVGKFIGKVFTNPAYFVFPVAQFLLGLISSMASFGLLLFWGIITSFAILMAQVLTPFMLLPGKVGAIKQMYKTFFSTALYGLAMKIIIWISNVILAGILKATNGIMVEKLINVAGTAGTAPGKAAIASLMMGNFMATFGVLCIQIMAMTKVPKIARQIMFLSLTEIVNLGETLLKAGMAMAGTLTAVAGAAALTVATAGAGAVVAGAGAAAAKTGAMAAVKAGGQMAAKGVTSAGSKAGSSMANMGAKAKGMIGNMGNKANKLIGDNSFGKATKSGFDKMGNLAEQAGNKAGEATESTVKATTKKTKSILKREFGMDDEEDGKSEGSGNTGSGTSGGGNSFSKGSAGKNNKKQGYLKTAFQKGGKASKNTISSLNKQAWSATNVGLSGGSDGEEGTQLVKDGMGATGDMISSASSNVQKSQELNKAKAQDALQGGLSNPTMGDPSSSNTDPFLTEKNIGDADSLYSKKDMTSDDNSKYNDLKSQVNTGSANNEQMEEFRQMNEKHNLSSEQSSQYEDLLKSNDSYSKHVSAKDNESQAFMEQMKMDHKYGNKLNDEKFKNIMENKDRLTQNNLNDPAMKSMISEYKAKEMSKIKNKISQSRSLMNDKAMLDNKTKQELLRYSKNKNLSQQLTPEENKSLSDMLKELKLKK